MDVQKIAAFCDRHWQMSVLPVLSDYIRVPCKSPLFDPKWADNGHMEQAMSLVAAWVVQQNIPGMRHEIIRLPGRTPLLFIEVPGALDREVLLYGHLDKQPEMTGWRAGLGPWTPVLADEGLYGRGGADDGYAVFACLTALSALAAEGVPYPRCVVIIEASEESGSPDLPAYMERLAAALGQPDLVICLDSCCGNYEQLWHTTSLRGMVGGCLTVRLLEQGVHSGDAGGVVPCPFRIMRQLLARIEDAKDGCILLSDCKVPVPVQRVRQAEQVADSLGDAVWQHFPFVVGARPSADAVREQVLHRSWYPALAVTGADYLPATADAGNVLHPAGALRLSLRLPPTVPASSAAARMREVLEASPPYGAQVCFIPDCIADGWHDTGPTSWLSSLLQQASWDFFGQPALYRGEGVSIPFVGMLATAFPQAQFWITGVLGPHSNAHGPNEYLHLGMARKLTAAIASVLAGVVS